MVRSKTRQFCCYNTHQKSWNTCDFSLPKCWLGYCSHLSAPKYAWCNIGEAKGHVWVKTKVRRVTVRNFQKNSRKTGAFSTINVTSIVVSNFGNYSGLSTVYYYMPCFASTSGQDELFLKWCNLLVIIHPSITKFIAVFLCVQFEDLNLLVSGKIVKRTWPISTHLKKNKLK